MARNFGFQTLKLTVPNLGKRGYHCNELPVPGGWLVPNLKKHTLPVEGSADLQKLELMFLHVALFFLTKPVAERFVLLPGPVPECLRLVPGKAGSQKLEPTVANWVTMARFPEVGTPGSQPGNQRLPLQRTFGS